MLIARAPLRISFGGGGTDLEAYYAKYGGMVVSAAIDKYFYAIVSTGDYNGFQIISSDYKSLHRHPDHESGVWDNNLALPRAIIEHFGLKRGLNIFLASEVPPGTGLGSSSTVAVALAKALCTLCEQELTRAQLAELAAYIEIVKLGMPIGKQDQYAASFGGINCITFDKNGVTVVPLEIPATTIKLLESSILLFFTGSSRDSTAILSKQREASAREEKTTIESLHAIKEGAKLIEEALLRGDIEQLGKTLHQSWQKKKLLAKGISNPFIDDCYHTALDNGALGGKITGAGGGGFLMICSPPEYRDRLTRALEAKGLKRMDFKFDFQGTRILLNTVSFNHRWAKESGEQ